MTAAEPLELPAEDGTVLRGWLRRPAGPGPHPLVVLQHGWAAVKEMYLAEVAEHLLHAGMACLGYDHRCVGESDGAPRGELDPWTQVRDARDVVTRARRLPGVDPARIGLWGSSYGGGHAIVLGAIDRRIGCVVAQVPTVSGWRSTLRRFPFDGLAELRGRLDADRDARLDGGAPATVPVAAGLDLDAARAQRADTAGPVGNDGARWYRSMEGGRLAKILGAYERAREPKRLVLLPGGHYDAYGDQRDAAAGAAAAWFAEHLGGQ